MDMDGFHLSLRLPTFSYVIPTPRACHGTSNGGVGAVRIVDPKDLVMGLDEEEQLQDLEGILSSGPPMIQSMPQGWSRLQP